MYFVWPLLCFQETCELSTCKTQEILHKNLHFWFLLKFWSSGHPGPTFSRHTVRPRGSSVLQTRHPWWLSPCQREMSPTDEQDYLSYAIRRWVKWVRFSGASRSRPEGISTVSNTQNIRKSTLNWKTGNTSVWRNSPLPGLIPHWYLHCGGVRSYHSPSHSGMHSFNSVCTEELTLRASSLSTGIYLLS